MIPWAIAHQAPLSMGFPSQQYWSVLLFSPPGDFPDKGIKSTSPVSPALQADSLPTEPSGKLKKQTNKQKKNHTTHSHIILGGDGMMRMG